MKFGDQLQKKLKADWRFYYIDYDGLKKQLKERTSSGTYFAENDEAGFVELLEKEVQKVFDFRDVKGGELTRHVQHCEKEVYHRLKDKKQLKAMEEEIERITNELTELANFTRLNYTGFMKILKKHDKHTQYMLKPMFMVRLNSKPLYLENLDNLILRLSKLYDLIRTGGEQREAGDSSGGAQNFQRKTTKYWVHPDNVTELKITILKHLPVLLFDKGKEQPDPAISSVYFDNEAMELYNGRIEKTEGAEAIRLRWYGSQEPQEVFVERKTHREDWTGELSVKSRFVLKEKHVNEYIHGKYSVDLLGAKLLSKKMKDEAAVEEMKSLGNDIQQTILTKNLHPTLRTFYNRTAFQLPGDARVRISLDTDLCMIREGQGDHWRRKDVLCEYPFSQLSANDIVRFPYAVLEVKLQTQHGQEPPKWVTSLVHSHLVEEVPKFSKYIHGCAILYESKVSLFPFWLPQMDIDIRRPPPVDNDHQISIPIPSTSKDDDDDSEEDTPLLQKQKKQTSNLPPPQKKIALPVRVEPKVFFANERTFLSWVQFSIFLGGLSSVMISLNDPAARVSGIVFSIVAVLFALYALFLYQWRAKKIRNRDPGPYDDRVGPTVLVVVFLFALIFNTVFHSIVMLLLFTS